MATLTKPSVVAAANHSTSRSIGHRTSKTNLPPETRSPVPQPFVRGFVELAAKSNFSFLQAASHPEEFVEQAIRYDYMGISIADLHGLYGVVRGFQTAKAPSLFAASVLPQDKFRYHFGAEFHLTEEIELICLPMNRSGYKQLCALLTLGKRNAPKGFAKLSLQAFQNSSDDLIAFALPPWKEEHLEKLQMIFKDRLYFPLWRDLTWESRDHYQQALVLEEKYDLQLFATQRPLMHASERKALLDTVHCIYHQTTLPEAKARLTSNAERCMRPLSELMDLWQDRLDLIDMTVTISDRLQFSLSELSYEYPRAQLPPGKNKEEHLRDLTFEGAKVRYPQGLPQKIQSLIEHELRLIIDLQYEDYFLTLFEICKYAQEKNILYQGRGSAANSAVCFCLGLTAVDPTKVDLLFERFISRERGEPPDIDIDFEHERREEVIQHIYQKYSAEHAAMVCTVIRYRSRMALREVAKVFAIPLATINRMIQFMGRDGLKRLYEPEICQRFQIPENQWALIMAMTEQIHGFPRHLGIHTGGFLITDTPLTEIVPVEKATMNGRYVIQWNKDDIDFLKLMKIDVLSLGMLTCLRKSFDLLKTHKNLDYQLYSLPQEDSKTYDMIGRAETVGVFQIESRAQMNALPRMKPRTFYDLVIEIALIRPGPLQGGMVHPFLKRRQGLEKVRYPHPDLEPVLRKTMGVPIFQEQVMKIAIVAAGFTPGEADELRRIMSSAWRKKATMEGVRHRITTGLLKHGLKVQDAESIFKILEGFANYGFPESHAASFAHLTYASCWLKCHHPEIFTCSLLNSQPMGFYAPRTLLDDLKRTGCEVLPVDLQFSDYDYTLQEGKLRVGFRALYGIPKMLLEKIISIRKNDGSYLSLQDLVRRAALPKTALMKIAASGALRSFASNTRQLLWEIESLSFEQDSFLWGSSKLSSPDELLEESQAIPFESNWQSLQREYESHGFSTDNHPLGILRTYLQAKNESYRQNRFIPYLDSQKIQDLRNKTKVRIAGLLSVTQRPPTAKGMCFLTLEDEFGFMNIVVPPQVYQKDRVTIYKNSLLEIQGVLEKSGPITNIRAERVLPMT